MVVRRSQGGVAVKKWPMQNRPRSPKESMVDYLLSANIDVELDLERDGGQGWEANL